MRIATLLLLLAVEAAASESPSPRNSLQPCDAEDVVTEVGEIIRTPELGSVIVSFTAFPSFGTEYGLVVFKTSDAFMLRAVEFDHSVFHSAYREVRPGLFAHDPAKANIDRSIDEVEISSELAQLVHSVVAGEVATATKLPEGWFGLDGETFRFSSGNESCATTWSPDNPSRPGQLVEAMESLHNLASVPTSWLRSLWEPSVSKKFMKLRRRDKPNKPLQPIAREDARSG